MVFWTLHVLLTGVTAYMVPQTMELSESNAFYTKHLSTLAPKLQLGFYKQRGSGLKAVSSIEEGETVLEVPWEYVISGEEPYYFSSYMKEGNLQIFLLGRLMFEKFMQDNSTSFINNYVHSLPVSLKNYPSWTPDQRELLTSHLFSHEYQDPELIRFESLFEEFKKQIAGLPKINHAMILRDSWAWAVSLVKSRAYRSKLADWGRIMNKTYSEEDSDKTMYLMVPLFDLINHDAKGIGSVEVQLTTKSFLVKAKRRIEAGEEVLLNYGVNHNIQLLKDYGFFVKANPLNVLTVTSLNATDCFGESHGSSCIYHINSTGYSEPLLRLFRKTSAGGDVLALEDNWYSNYYSLAHVSNSETRVSLGRALKNYRHMLETKHHERPDMQSLRGKLDSYESSQQVERMILEFLLDEHRDFYRHLDHIDRMLFKITLTESWLFSSAELKQMLGIAEVKDEL
jgi:hypothetical protein